MQYAHEYFCLITCSSILLKDLIFTKKNLLLSNAEKIPLLAWRTKAMTETMALKFNP